MKYGLVWNHDGPSVVRGYTPPVGVTIELTEAEFADWCRVSQEWDEWVQRLDDLEYAARRKAATG